MSCPNFKNSRCMLDPRYHKPAGPEVTTYCGTENYYNCPMVSKYSGLEGMSC